jgi:Mg-chelatase subunit ChlD
MMPLQSLSAFRLFWLVFLFFTASCAPALSPDHVTAALKGERPADGREKKKSAIGESDASAADPLKMAEAGAPAAAPVLEKTADALNRAANSGGLQAGYADDNKQFNYFVHFLETFSSQVPHYKINISERITLKVVDAVGKPVPNAEVAVSGDGSDLETGKTWSDGTFLFFPSAHLSTLSRYNVSVISNQQKQNILIDRQGPREVEVHLGRERSIPGQIPLDVLFVLDTTGSMGKEIERLKKTIEIINLNLGSLSTKTSVRFGMVLYKDRRDEYVTKIVNLTGNLEEFQEELNRVRAGGGGDGPEDLQTALMDAVQKISWNPEGIRLAFIVTDEQPHLDYGQTYTYANAAEDAKKQGIKIFSVGTGGLPLAGELVLRQIAQYTSGRYIFLTYGEKGESEGGREGSVSHHTGDNFQTDKLEAIIIRFAKEEINNILGTSEERDEDYFSATKVGDEKNADTLQKLFEQAVGQLVDFSTIAIPERTPASVLPISSRDAGLSLNAEYLGEQLALTLSRNKVFTMVERKDLQTVLDELKIQMTGLVSEKDAVKVGKLIGAKMIIAGNIYATAENYDLFLKLIRVESSEVLSVTKAKINKKLAL